MYYLMNSHKARLSFQSLKQVKGHLQILRQAFARYDCMDCGICCSEKNHQVPILPGDPNRGRILDAANAISPDSIVPINFLSFMVAGDEKCPFLDAEKKCSIYPSRPVICRSFPIMLQSMNTKTADGELTKMDFFALSSLCPAVAAARDDGLRFISAYDIRRIRKSPKLKRSLSVLIKSYRNIQECIKNGIAYYNGNFIESDGNRIIPVF